MSEDGPQQPLSSVPGYMGLSENTTELQSFPPINTPTEETPDTATAADDLAESKGTLPIVIPLVNLHTACMMHRAKTGLRIYGKSDLSYSVYYMYFVK